MTDVLNLPRPAWMSEDVVLLEETARRFIAAEYGPHLEKWHEDRFYPREVWTKAGADYIDDSDIRACIATRG